ncbi:MAG: hypothetical protein MJ072_00950, partial [Clostridia bacterium]|nr:hypothetical protein [Clostridia bacterium]
GGTFGSDLKADMFNLCIWHYWNCIDFNASGSAGTLVIPTASGRYVDTTNNSTTVAVAGVPAGGHSGETYKNLQFISGLDVDGALITEDGAPKLFVVKYDDFYDNVKDGVYSVKDGEETVSYTVYDPETDGIDGYKSEKYGPAILTAPKAEYKIVIGSVKVG